MSTLNAKLYNARHNGLLAARAGALLSEFTGSHEFSPTSPSRAVAYLKKYQEMSGLYRYPAIADEVVLDYGCGIHNPLGIAILLYINGANSIVAFDPGAIEPALVKISAAELAQKILADPASVNVSGIPVDLMMTRFAELDWPAMLAGRIGDIESPIRFHTGNLRDFAGSYAGRFTSILSTTVLEHVEDMAEQAALMRSVTTDGAVLVHRIDLTDHRHFLPDYHPLAFMKTGLYPGLNGLRHKDFVALFREAGFEIAKEDLVRRTLAPEFLDAIEPRWKSYTEDEISITYAGLTLVGQPDDPRRAPASAAS